MSEADLLLKAYYEALYERIEVNKGHLAARIEELLPDEFANRGFECLDGEKYAAYRDTCLAFVDERIESYNPIGIQYLFDPDRRHQAVELELQLNWFDSTEEFQQLVQAARRKAPAEVTEQSLIPLVDELIRQFGAFPDRSIISAYQTAPSLNKLPDYIVARAIEEIIRRKFT